MNQKTTIQIFCTINPSEDPDKIKTAVNNIFPEIELDVSETCLLYTSPSPRD